MKKIVSLFLCFILLLPFAGCHQSEEEPGTYIHSIEELKSGSYSIGVGVGTAAVSDVEAELPALELMSYNSAEDGYLAVQLGMLDAFAFSRANMEFALASGSLHGVRILDGNVGEGTDAVVGISRKCSIPDLTESLNAFIAAIHADGSFEEMYRRWVREGATAMPEDLPRAEAPALTLRVGTNGGCVPFCYYQDNALAGLDVELLYRFAAYINADVELTVADFTSLAAAAETGAIDCIFANLNATPERAELMDFSDPIYSLPTAVMVRAENNGTPQLYQFNREDASIGVLTGSFHDTYMQQCFPKAQVKYFSSAADMPVAINGGVIDGFITGEGNAKLLTQEIDGLTVLGGFAESIDCGFAFPQTDEGARLCAEMSEFIRTRRANGRLEEMLTKWLSGEGTNIDFPVAYGKEKTLRFATSSGDSQPYTYILNGAPVGYEVELAADFCRAYGYGLEISDVDFSAILPGLSSGVYDFAANIIAITPERSESVLFATPHMQDTPVLVVRNEVPSDSAEALSFWDSLALSFEKNFIREQRWKLILNGIETTLFISVLSLVFGTALGFALCMLRRKRGRLSFPLTTVYIRIMQGTPLLVLLMVLYYLVFPGTGLSGSWVAIIAFSLNLAAYVSEMLRSGIEAVPVGQMEAALALGFPRRRAFVKFVLPQAAQHFLPVYKGEVISTVKLTSVVGYIAVQDLTKVSDIIRSRTYEAFFPLLSTALLYFLLSALLGAILRYIEHRIEPDRSHRTVKGVSMKS